MDWKQTRCTKQIDYFDGTNILFMPEKNNLMMHFVSMNKVRDQDIIDFDYFKSLEENKKLAFFGGRLTSRDINLSLIHI